MKIIDILIKISKNEIKEGTKIKMLGKIYKYKEGYLALDSDEVRPFYVSQRLLNDDAEIVMEEK